MSRTTRPDLSNVTLCAADSLHPALAARALDISASHCNFGDAILFTHQDVASGVRTEIIQRLQSREDYSAFMLKHLVHYVSTPWVLVTQWDGYVLDPSAWSGEFLDYDYIGAVWPFHRDSMRVGNGGFSLRSARLLKALAEPEFEFIRGANEDDLICRMYRSQLETHYGIRFAPENVADRFAYEHVRPGTPTFGFHGAFNMWRHVDDSTMMKIVLQLDPRTFTSNEVMLLMKVYCDLRKFDCVRTMYERYRRLWSTEQVIHNMMKTGLTGQAVLQYVDICEGVIREYDRGLAR